MAKIIGGIGIAHTPSMGMEFDKASRTGAFSPNWQLWYDGTRPVKSWVDNQQIDHIIVVYNDHLNQFSFDTYPTLAAGVAEWFPQADESFGLRPFPRMDGDPCFAWPIVTSLVNQEFDLTICQVMEIDHGIYSWFPYLFDVPWKAPILPIAVNMLRIPVPTSRRLWKLGDAIRRAVQELPTDDHVLVISTGGMSHQIVGERFGMANEDLDRFFLSHLAQDPQRLVAIPQTKYQELGGTEAAELAIWFAMRAALGEKVDEIYAFQTFPSITGCGVIILEPRP